MIGRQTNGDFNDVVEEHGRFRLVITYIELDRRRREQCSLPQEAVPERTDRRRAPSIIDNVVLRAVKKEGFEGRLKIDSIRPDRPAAAALLPRIELIGEL